MYRFALLDPRRVEAAEAANTAVFDTEQGVLGIEVTIPELALRCTLGNIDPQHTGGDANRAAIEDALTTELPGEGSTLATVRADLDAVGTMAILSLRAQGAWDMDVPCPSCGQSSQDGERYDGPVRLEDCFPHQAESWWRGERVGLVARSDRFARGWWRAKGLPSTLVPWPEGTDAQFLVAIGTAVADLKVPIVERVALMEQWLLSGEEPAGYREKAEAERGELIAAIEGGQIKLRLVGDWLSVVETAHRAATMIGYSAAPVVLALNPNFRLGGGDAHLKYTLCQFEAGWVDLKAALSDLQALESGWGGSPTIVGSPQGVGSTLTVDQIVEVVSRHLLRTPAAVV